MHGLSSRYHIVDSFGISLLVVSTQDGVRNAQTTVSSRLTNFLAAINV